MNNEQCFDSENNIKAQNENTLSIPIQKFVESKIDLYFKTLDGQSVKDLYALVRKEIETGLLKAVMRHTKGNQSQAALQLGLARGTLRKMLQEYNLS